MTGRLPALACVLLVFAAHSAAQPVPPGQTTPLAFRIDEGRNINSFLREGAVAAHLLLRSGNEPRILVAFPAGNSGVGLWFDKTDVEVTWTLIAPPRAISAVDHQQRVLQGIEFEVETNARLLRIRQAVLSSIRVLRDFELQGKAPPEVIVAPRAAGGSITWSRDRLDGAAGYQLRIEARGEASPQQLTSASAPMRLRVQVFSGEPPLKPLPALLNSRAGADPRARNALDFLSYEDKFLAGSWRFNTYFGRDTLISALLLLPVLEPRAVDSAINSVLDRLAPNGEVAHEEDIGEFAVLRNSLEGRGRVATPIHDYGMVDDDFLLAPLAARWLLDDERGKGRAAEFLRARGVTGESRGKQLARNVSWVVSRAAAFAASPRAENLVGIKAGRMTGNWRDSEQGLGRGRYAYDVNAALVPSALDAAARLAASGLLEPYLDAAQRVELAQARERQRVWSAHASDKFDVSIPAIRARADIVAYAREIGVGVPVKGMPEKDLFEFHALSLDAQGKPVPILNSDEGFRLLLTAPTPEELERCLAAILQPFPVGLLTDAGLLVANPAHAGAAVRQEFSRFAYHGTVVWSWQQALLAAGLERQLQRGDLPEATRVRVEEARQKLWKVIEKTRELRTSELWSWSYAGGRYRAEPFGRPGADADESNAAQLWSTVFLGLKPAATD